MNDRMDSYLSRCLKNWVARQPPAPRDRERLLKLAAQSADLEKSPSHTIDSLLQRPGDWLGPITQTRLWSFHIALDLRQVT